MTNIDRNIRSQRGVALLFALGVLSLMLVTGIAFLGNVLITQKIVIYRAESSSAKHLLSTAQERAMAHLNIFNLMQVSRSGDFYAGDASSVFSRMSTTAFTAGTAATSIAHDQLYADNGTDDPVERSVPSLLSVKRSKFLTPSWYNGEKSMAQWIYVHQDGTFSAGNGGNSSPIIGRFAYQVLPQTSNSRLALYAVTAGGKTGGIAKLGSQETDTYTRVPQKHRWGLEIDELNIKNLNNMFYFWSIKSDGSEQLCDPVADFDIFTGMLSGNAADNGNAINALYNDDEKTENRKRWLEHFFVEGKGRVAREAYPVKISADNVLWFPRFNLGEHLYWYDADKNEKGKFEDTLDPWYRRFVDITASVENRKKKIEEIQNSNDVIDRLTAVPHRDDGRFSDTYFTDQHDAFGLPFLRRIGHKDEKGGFSKIEYLRKQIAANLNDYCDADSVPTSNVPAKDWKDAVSKTGESEVPQYTGNEKTPYINEAAFGFRLKNARFETQGGTYLFKTDPLEAELLAELISVYKGVALDSSTKLYSRVKSLSITFSVSFTAEAQGSYNDGENVKNVSGSVGETNRLLKVDFPVDKDVKIKFTGDSLVGNGPYWIGSSEKIKRDGDLSIDFTDKIKSDLGCADQTLTALTVNLKTASIKVDKIAFNLGHLVLTQGSGADETGIDFVKFDSSDERIITFADEAKPVVFESDQNKDSNAATQLADATKDDKGIFYCGGMQVFDPRQNLNANKTADKKSPSYLSEARKNDWYLTEGEPTFKLNTANRDEWQWDFENNGKLKDRISDGAVNTHSNPKTAFGELAAGNGFTEAQPRDTETAEDPAWQGDADDKHISTAVIRNAPMQSPWELGFIHRGIPFQTINLKKAGGIDGTAVLAENAHDPNNFKEWSAMETEAPGTQYQYGDAGILDQIKMTPYNKSYGKIDFSSLVCPPVNWITAGASESFMDLANEILKGLFAGVKPYKPWEFVEHVQKLTDKPTWATDKDAAANADLMAAATISTGDLPVNDWWLRSKYLTDFLGEHVSTQTNDAAKEELIGRTVNLTEGRSASVPNVFKIVIAAQKIRDLSGNIGKKDFNDQLVMAADKLGKDAAIGTFDAVIDTDPDKSVYFDEILATSRMLVTVEKIHYMEGDKPRARLRVKQIEYLD